MALTGTERWTYELTRKAYGETLVALGHENPRVVVLDADLAESTLSKFFRAEFPDRFIEMGIAEQDMVGTAAGPVVGATPVTEAPPTETSMRSTHGFAPPLATSLIVFVPPCT